MKAFALLVFMAPLIIAGSGWVGSRLNVVLSRQHFTVALAEEVMAEDSGVRNEMSDETKAFRASGVPTAQLLADARAVRKKFLTGGWFLGCFLGLIFFFKVVKLTRKKRREEYQVNTGTCFSCGRCFSYCPYEQVRLGNITSEEVEELKQSLRNED